MLGSRDGRKATSVIWQLRNPAGRTPDLPIDILPATYYYSLRMFDATKMSFLPERMSNRRPSLSLSVRAAAFYALLAASAALFLGAPTSSACSLNAGTSLSCSQATNESGAASVPILQQPGPAEPQPLVPGKS